MYYITAWLLVVTAKPYRGDVMMKGTSDSARQQRAAAHLPVESPRNCPYATV